MNISQALKEIRKKQGMRQGVVAAKANITQTYLSLIENGEREPSIGVLKKLAKVYKTPFSVMMWFALNENDIHKSKLEAYRALKPSIDSLINSIF